MTFQRSRILPPGPPLSRCPGLSGAPAGQRGTYRIDGLVIHITHGDGATARHILITDPGDAKAAIWIDDNGYVRRGE